MFKAGRESVEDSRSGRPRTSITKDQIVAVQVVKVDRRWIACSEVGISHGSVISILHDSLDLNKVSSRWIPILLSGGTGCGWNVVSSC